MEVIDNKEVKKGFKKDTGISNMPLPTGFTFYHTDILFSVFAAKRICNDGSKVNRFYDESTKNKTKQITVFGDFLNIDTDFMLYTFLLEKLERDNIFTHKDHVNLTVTTSFREIHDSFGKNLVKRGGKEIFNVYHKSLFNLQSVSLKINNEVVSLIERFQSFWDEDFDQHREFKITFPPEIKYLGGTQSLLDKEKFKSLKEYSQSHKKLYAYISSFNNIKKFNVSTLYRVLGYTSEGVIIDEYGNEKEYCKNLKNARSNLKQILEDLVWEGLIKHSKTFDIRAAKQYEIVKVSDIKKNKKD